MVWPREEPSAYLCNRQFSDTLRCVSEVGYVKEARLEYLYADFGRLTRRRTISPRSHSPVAFRANGFTHSMELHSHVIGAGFDQQW